MKYQHIVWDWNGTLVDDAELCVVILNQILNDYGKMPVDRAFYLDNFSFPVCEYYKSLGLPSCGPEYQEISQRFIEEYRKKHHICKLQKSSVKMLSYIKGCGISQSVLSAGNIADVLDFVEYHKLSDFFTIISGVYHTNATGKSDVAHKHLNQIQACTSEILLIGDTLHDFEIATDLKVDCVLYSKGHNSKNRLLEASNSVINDLEELVGLID
ncbi:MAG TPA: hypothetical protein DHU78_01930 [Opitutae bacterium]|nr:hypothetical protein [Opitutae bacterium]|tara:strand:+ start:11624 stop:12262 length:639 start_codon:yes stop_codon:yes gene_type:complete